jgi:hypothetical protein
MLSPYILEKTVPGTCEEIGFIDFGTMNLQWFTVWITGQNSIFSHVPDTLFPDFPLDSPYDVPGVGNKVMAGDHDGGS